MGTFNSSFEETAFHDVGISPVLDENPYGSLLKEFAPMSLAELAQRFDFSSGIKNETGRESWYAFCTRFHKIYEYPTAEYVAALSGYLIERAVAISELVDEPVRILEVGAGEGRLTFLLAETFRQLGASAIFRATDDLSWPRTILRRQDDQVTEAISLTDRLGCAEAVKDEKPHIVIAAWVPGPIRPNIGATRDWTKDFRACSETQEYILIGPIEGHGHPEAWGLDAVCDMATESWVTVRKKEPVYQREGFERVDLPHLSPLQVCYLSNTDDMHPSATVAFRRTRAVIN